MSGVVVGVLALQGAFIEHITLLRAAIENIRASTTPSVSPSTPARPSAAVTSTSTSTSTATGAAAAAAATAAAHIELTEVRTALQLARCDALILPGGESTSISLIAERTGLLEPLREFVKVQRKPVWGTCAGLILLAESANKSKASGQELIGGLDVRVHRNYFGRQVESFEADLLLTFLPDDAPFHTIFIRAPVVEKVLLPATVVEAPSSSSVDTAAQTAEVVLAPQRQATAAPVEILGRLPGRARALRDKTTTAQDLGEDGDIVAVRQGNVFGTAFHPELTADARIHEWWLREVLERKAPGSSPASA